MAKCVLLYFYILILIVFYIFIICGFDCTDIEVYTFIFLYINTHCFLYIYYFESTILFLSKAVVSGENRQGDKKDGLNTHIHIIVSARDISQKIVLNPQTKSTKRFSQVNWAEANAEKFQKMFGFEKGVTRFKKDDLYKRIRRCEFIVHDLKNKGYINKDQAQKIENISRDKGYSREFYNELNRSKRIAEKNKSFDFSTFEKLNNSKGESLHSQIKQPIIRSLYIPEVDRRNYKKANHLDENNRYEM